MLKQLWSDHRNSCLLTLALLVISIVVSPWVLLSALLPVAWVLLRDKPAKENQPLTITEEAESISELPKEWSELDWDKKVEKLKENNVDKQVLEILSKSNDAKIRKAVALSPNTSQSILTKLSNDESEYVQDGVTERSLPNEWKVIDETEKIKKLKEENVEEKVLEIFSKFHNWRIRKALISISKRKYYLLFAKKIPDNQWLNKTNSFYHESESDCSIEYQDIGIYVFKKNVNIDDLFNMRFSCAGDLGSGEPDEEYNGEVGDETTPPIMEGGLDLTDYHSDYNGLQTLEIDAKTSQIKKSNLSAYVVEVSDTARKVVWSCKLEELEPNAIKIESCFSLYPTDNLEKHTKYQFFTLSEGGWIERQYQPLLLAVNDFDPNLLKLVFLTQGPLGKNFILSGFIYNGIHGSDMRSYQDEIDREANDSYCEKDVDIFSPDELLSQVKLLDAE